MVARMKAVVVSLVVALLTIQGWAAESRYRLTRPEQIKEALYYAPELGDLAVAHILAGEFRAHVSSIELRCREEASSLGSGTTYLTGLITVSSPFVVLEERRFSRSGAYRCSEFDRISRL